MTETAGPVGALAEWPLTLAALVFLAAYSSRVLRPLRLLRLVTLLSVLNRYAGASLRGAWPSTSGLGRPRALRRRTGRPGRRTRCKGATIETFGDSLWWAIALLGVVTAPLASWLIERVSQVEEESQAATRRDVAASAAEVRAVREDVADLTGERDRSGSARP